MKLTLYGRTQPFRPLKSYPLTIEDYAFAVAEGQRVFGYGNFLVDTGEAVPCRETQLLTETPAQRKQRLLNEI